MQPVRKNRQKKAGGHGESRSDASADLADDSDVEQIEDEDEAKESTSSKSGGLSDEEISRRDMSAEPASVARRRPDARPRPRRSATAEARSAATNPVPITDTDDIMSEQHSNDSSQQSAEEAVSRPVSNTVSRLEEEGEIGADYLEELLDIADLGGDIDIDIDHGRASIAVVASEEGDERELADLVGRDGEVLESVQELTRLAVQARTGNRSRLMLDINGYRADRRVELTKVAQEAVTKVLTSGEAVSLEPMNPFERKVCHDVVAAAGLVSESEGAEPHRYVVVLPADENDEQAVDKADVNDAADDSASEQA